MKKAIFHLISICLIFTFIIACDKDEFNGSDNLITITRDLSPFTSVIAQDDLDVTIVQNDEQFVEIDVNENLQNRLKTTVVNNILIISLEDGSYDNETFVVNMQMPILKRLQLDDNTRAKVNFTSNQMEFEVNDSAALTLQGTSDVLNTKVNDDGEINGFSFTTEILNTVSRDASELEITCTTELNGKVDEAATVRYRGMPVINAQTSEDSEIIDAN